MKAKHITVKLKQLFDIKFTYKIVSIFIIILIIIFLLYLYKYPQYNFIIYQTKLPTIV
jgi:hypothetical protein